MTEVECGTIYKITSPSGKVYIGQTTRPVEERWKQYERLECKNQPRLYNSFMKYGYENHEFEIIITGITSKEMLDSYEIFYIAIYDSAGENGLNCTLGGEGRHVPEEKLKFGLRTGDKGYWKAKRLANVEIDNARHKAYRETHKEERKAYDKKYHEANKERRNAWNKTTNEREKAIRTYFGYKQLEWIALSKEERALLRSQFRK